MSSRSGHGGLSVLPRGDGGQDCSRPLAASATLSAALSGPAHGAAVLFHQAPQVEKTIVPGAVVEASTCDDLETGAVVGFDVTEPIPRRPRVGEQHRPCSGGARAV